MVFIIILFFILISLFIYSLEFILVLDYELFTSLSNIFYSLIFEFNTINGYVLAMLLICSLLVFNFYNHYFLYHYDYLFNLILLFIGVMAYLVTTGNLCNSLIGWEYLGIVSFFLILYYNNYSSSRSAVITLIVSRLGDAAFFILSGIFFFYDSYYFGFLLVLVFSIVGTKSAFYPISSWLIEAMRAPTPVSSLVHSSTLVAGGVWFLMFYYFYLFSSYPYLQHYFNSFLTIFCLVSIILSGMSALGFNDLKKIVAFSTCNNISWCFIYFINGGYFYCLLQLFIHGVIKCALFCSVGDKLISNNLAQNKISYFNNLSYSNSLSLFLLNLSICGGLFFGVYFIKHVMLVTSFSLPNIVIFFLIYFSIFLSFIYCFNFIGLFLSTNNSLNNNGFIHNFYYIPIFLIFVLLISYLLSFNILEYGLLTPYQNLVFFILTTGISFLLLYFNIGLPMSVWFSNFMGLDWIINSAYSVSINILLRISYVFLYIWERGAIINLINSLNIINFFLLSIAIIIGIIFLLV
uniref:NADH:ubiquinone reductase (H(+)-translocating) n=1 Tax=Aglaiogyrodactylus forficulatus TaxID=1853073 RepID=A0A173G4S7_9PLAT|nr:NADH dehydrogenase subunit 5 [Aglaiogyrodactylus forficulatus]ANH20412.1 NADH dehydrogenase subunit 5 [Aglaiogyrodactylus forficulatus]